MKKLFLPIILLASLPARSETISLTLQDLLSPGGGPGGRAFVLSPDGKYFAAVNKGQIELVPVNGGPAAPVTSNSGAKSELSWSPDGKQIAYVSGGGVWVVAVSGGEPRHLTDGPPGPGDPRGATDHFPRWNPKGKWILFQSGRRGWNELYVISEDGKTKNYLAATELYDGRDRIGDQDGDAVSSDRFDPNPAWSPDGTRVSYTERSRRFFSGKLKVLRFDQETGQKQGDAIDLYTAKNDRGGAWAINTAAWSPDSKTLAVVLQETGWDKIFLIPSGGGRPKQITKGESEDETPVYSPDGKFIAFASNRDNPEERHIWIARADGSSPRCLTNLAGIEGGTHWSPDGQTIYFSRGTVVEPAVLYVASVNGHSEPHPFVPVRPSKFAETGLLPPQVVHFQGKDGLKLSGILYHPLGFQSGTRYPAIIWAHGGPEGQDMLTLSPWSLYLAQQGYVVFLPNFRGSTGYGEKFRNLNVEDSGGGEIDDIGAAVKDLVDQGLADPRRVAIGGGSHGGTVVANAVTKLPDTFAAAIELFGVVDRAIFLQYTNRNSKIRWETKMGGTPEEKPAVYRKANILPDAGKIKTPLLIMHGEEDPQVPPQESVAFVAALKQAGKVYTYITYPHEGHGFQNPEHRLDAWQKQVDFLKKYLNAEK